MRRGQEWSAASCVRAPPIKLPVYVLLVTEREPAREDVGSDRLGGRPAGRRGGPPGLPRCVLECV